MSILLPAPVGTMRVRKTLLDGVAYVGRYKQQQQPHERLQLAVLRQYKDLLKQTKFLFDENARFQCSRAMADVGKENMSLPEYGKDSGTICSHKGCNA